MRLNVPYLTFLPFSCFQSHEGVIQGATSCYVEQIRLQVACGDGGGLLGRCGWVGGAIRGKAPDPHLPEVVGPLIC